MKNYEKLKKLKPELFKRLTGVVKRTAKIGTKEYKERVVF